MPLDGAHRAKQRIDEELVSVESMEHVLRTRCGCHRVCIYREQVDPPDFTVTIDGESFPTEVTSIVSHQAYEAHCKDFAKAISHSTALLGVFSGTYAFMVFRLPSIPKPTSPDGHQLLDAATSYILDTQHQTTFPKLQLIGDKSGRVSISKISDNGSTVELIWSAPGMWEGEIRSRLTDLIQQAVHNKKSKLQKVGVLPQTAMLLLYDAFGYGSPEDAITAIRQVRGFDWFHTVFWAASFFDRQNKTFPSEPGREGCFLFSSNQHWDRVGTVPMGTIT